jgi:hypothetical protein
MEFEKTLFRVHERLLQDPMSKRVLLTCIAFFFVVSSFCTVTFLLANHYYEAKQSCKASMQFLVILLLTNILDRWKWNPVDLLCFSNGRIRLIIDCVFNERAHQFKPIFERSPQFHSTEPHNLKELLLPIANIRIRIRTNNRLREPHHQWPRSFLPRVTFNNNNLGNSTSTSKITTHKKSGLGASQHSENTIKNRKYFNDSSWKYLKSWKSCLDYSSSQLSLHFISKLQSFAHRFSFLSSVIITFNNISGMCGQPRQ